jgi:fluoride ion exporter CrcB/FEX
MKAKKGQTIIVILMYEKASVESPRSNIETVSTENADTVAIAQQFVSEQMVLVFATGFLGAFTTMSAFSVETVSMFDRGDSTLAFSYISITMIVCPFLAFIGWKLGESIWL